MTKAHLDEYVGLDCSECGRSRMLFLDDPLRLQCEKCEHAVFLLVDLAVIQERNREGDILSEVMESPSSMRPNRPRMRASLDPRPPRLR